MDVFGDQVKTFSDPQQCISWIESERVRLGSQVAFNRYRIDDKPPVLSAPSEGAVWSKISLYLEMRGPSGGPALIDSFLKAKPVAVTLKCLSVPQLELCIIFAASQTLTDVSIFCVRFIDEILNLRAANEVSLRRHDGSALGGLDMRKSLGDLVDSCVFFAFDPQAAVSPPPVSPKITRVVTLVKPGKTFVELKHNVRAGPDTIGRTVLQEISSRLNVNWTKLQLFVVKDDGYSIEMLDPQKAMPQNAEIRVQQRFDGSPVTVAILNKTRNGHPEPSGTVFQMEWQGQVVLLPAKVAKKRIMDYIQRPIDDVYVRMANDRSQIKGTYNLSEIQCICAVVNS
jgi:hypothetical protein